MKRLWISVALLAAIFAVTLWNVGYLSRFSTEVAGLLTDAGERAGRGDWAGASSRTEEARALWEGKESYLYITLIHSKTDEIYVGFHEVTEYLARREDEEYFAANARLVAKLELLHEMDEFNIRNIL